MSDEFETVILVKNEVNVYRIPPRQSNRDYRAADWNLSTPDWKGRMRVVSCGKSLALKLEDATSGELFAKCPIDPDNPGQALESVSDSSRYFVIRLQDDNGRTAFIGIGFEDRGDSFDLNVVIQEHIKHLKTEKEAAEEMTAPPQPALDLTLKNGETLTLQINTKRQPPKKTYINDDDDDDDDDDEGGPSKARLRTREALAAQGINAQSNTGAGLLPPPPAGKRGRSPDRRRPVSEGPTATKDLSGNKSAVEMFDNLNTANNK